MIVAIVVTFAALAAIVVRGVIPWVRRHPPSTAVMILVTLLAVSVEGGLTFWVAQNTNTVVHQQDFSTQEAIDHRVRNEIAHDAQCRKLDVVLRVEFAIVLRFGVKPQDLVDENGKHVVDNTGHVIDDNGKQVDCPIPLTEDQIRHLQLNPGDN